MKRTSSRFRWTLCAFALLLLAGLPQAALACGYACMPLPWDPSCDACQYVGGGGGGCVQVGTCGCYEIQCAVTPPSEEEVAAANLGFVPVDLQPAAECTDTPIASLVTD